jgi:FkbM family methyltransferase
MLISKEKVVSYLQSASINLHGALHIGAHECEELDMYRYAGIPDTSVVWIDALPDKVEEAVQRGVPNVFQAVVSDQDDVTVEFKRTNNNQSSSILELGTHAHNYAWCVVTERVTMTTTTIDTFMAKNGLHPAHFPFWNLDIQGAELQALKGGEQSLKHAKVLYLEVNSEEVYKGCALIGEIDDFLRDRGFRRVMTEMVAEGWGDAMYVRIPLIFDIGANVGHYALANYRNGEAKVVSVEASPITYPTLQSAVQGTNIDALHYAVSSVSAPSVRFHHCHGAHVLSTTDITWLTSPESRFGNYGSTVQSMDVPTITLDALIQRYWIPDVVKIDVEGAEDDVIASLTQKVPVVCFEWAAEWSEKNLRAINLLVDLGFTAFHIQHQDNYTYTPESMELSHAEVTSRMLEQVNKVEWGMLWAK